MVVVGLSPIILWNYRFIITIDQTTRSQRASKYETQLRPYEQGLVEDEKTLLLGERKSNCGEWGSDLGMPRLLEVLGGWALKASFVKFGGFHLCCGDREDCGIRSVHHRVGQMFNRS